MDKEEALTVVKRIARSIDENVEVHVTQTREEWGRDVYSVHLSIWGIPVRFEVTLEEIINARTDDSELRARLEEEIEHIREQREWKVIVDGTIGMLQPLLVHLAAEQGLSAQPSSGRPDWASGEPHFASFRISKRGAEGLSDSLGRIAMRDLPHERAQLTFTRTVGGKLPPEERQAQFIEFHNKFIDRLVEDGFLEKPQPPKRRFGFPTGTTDPGPHRATKKHGPSR